MSEGDSGRLILEGARGAKSSKNQGGALSVSIVSTLEGLLLPVLATRGKRQVVIASQMLFNFKALRFVSPLLNFDV